MTGTKINSENKENNFKQIFKSLSRLNLVYTLLLYLAYFGYGITVNIFGSTMVDMAKVYNVSLNIMSNGLVSNSLGYMLGTLAPFSYRWLNRQLVFSIFVILLGLSNTLLPLFNTVWVLYLLLALIGVFMGVLSSSNSMWLIDMYPNVAITAVLQGQVICYGLGTILAPILAAPYIYGVQNVTESGQFLTPQLRRQNLMVPFSINGVLQTVPALILLILFFTNRYRPPSTKTQTQLSRKSVDFTRRSSVFAIDLEQSKETNSISNRAAKLALGCVCLAMYFTAETGYFPYVSTCWQYMEIKFSAAEAATLMSVLSTTYALGPLVSMAVSMRGVSVDNILSYHYVFLFTGVGILYFGRLSRPMIYLGSGILGYGMSAMTAGLTAFSNDHLRLSNRVASMYSFTSGTVSMAIPLVIGHFLESQPIMLLYLAASFIAISLILFVLLRVWLVCSNKKNKISSNTNQVTVQQKF